MYTFSYATEPLADSAHPNFDPLANTMQQAYQLVQAETVDPVT